MSVLKGVLRIVLVACALLCLIRISDHLVVIARQHSIPVTPLEAESVEQNPPSASTRSAKEVINATNNTASRSSPLSVATGDPLTAILNKIIHSLEENGSEAEHKLASSQTNDKIVVMGRLEDDNTAWVAANLPLYVHPPARLVRFCFEGPERLNLV